MGFTKPGFTLIKRAIAGGLLSAAMVNAISSERKEQEVRMYVEINLEQLIQEQEERIGIQYPAQRPVIHYHLPADKSGNFGLYDRKTNEIFLQNDRYELPDWDVETVYDTINHELAHYYLDKLSEKRTNTNWPEYNDRTMLEKLGIKLISEGTATYIERKMNGKEDTFTDAKWPKALGGFFSSWELIPKDEIVYSGGFHLVKPIIDRYGEKGIEYLLFNPPKGQEMFNLPLYQQRILEELSRP
ncbi:MAG: hypothetical protein Q8R47_04785 [Nanoarchaeota archaeon]|nr:hypothetical protein [Nanoarchaeota archaeon]